MGDKAAFLHRRDRREMLSGRESEEDVRNIRLNTGAAHPLGSDRFRSKVERIGPACWQVQKAGEATRMSTQVGAYPQFAELSGWHVR